MFAVHVHCAKRTAVRLANDHDRVARAAQRWRPLRQALDRLRDGWGVAHASGAECVRLGQGKRRWPSVALLHSLFRRCAKVLQRFFQVLPKQWCSLAARTPWRAYHFAPVKPSAELTIRCLRRRCRRSPPRRGGCSGRHGRLRCGRSAGQSMAKSGTPRCRARGWRGGWLGRREQGGRGMGR